MPLSRAALTALRATRAEAPYATRTISASSTRYDSARCSLRSIVALETLHHELFEGLSGQIQGIRDVVRALVLVPDRRPGLFGKVGGIDGVGQLDGLHHLAEHAVTEDHNGRTVLVGDVERGEREVAHLLHGRGCEDDDVEVAVAGCARRLPVIRLGRLDAAEAGATALNVDDDARQIGTRHVGDALALERDAGRRRGRHDARARSRSAVDHVDRGDLAFSLKVGPSDLGHALGHVGRKLGLRRDGVTEEEAASRTQRAFCESLVSLHHDFLCHDNPYLSTVMATSGHISAHEQHPVHASRSMQCAGW